MTGELSPLNSWILDCNKLTQHNSKAAIETAASSMSLLLDCSKVHREGWESSSSSFEWDYPTSFFFLPPDSPFNLPTFKWTSLCLPSLYHEQSESSTYSRAKESHCYNQDGFHACLCQFKCKDNLISTFSVSVFSLTLFRKSARMLVPLDICSNIISKA